MKEGILLEGEIRIPERNKDEQLRKRESKNNKENQKHQERKRMTIIGDSMLNGLDENSMKRHYSVQVRVHSGANKHVIKDHVQSIMRRTPDCTISHTGTNDLTRETDTITTSGVNINQKVVQLNKELCSLSKDMNVKEITHPNLDKSCLSKKL